MREKELNMTATNQNGKVRPANKKSIAAKMVGLIRSLSLEQQLLIKWKTTMKEYDECKAHINMNPEEYGS